MRVGFLEGSEHHDVQHVRAAVTMDRLLVPYETSTSQNRGISMDFLLTLCPHCYWVHSIEQL